jgi:hypothetical protein
MKHLKRFNENVTEYQLVDDFIDHLHNHNDLFYNTKPKYTFDEKTGEIKIDLSRFSSQNADRFVEQVKELINSDKELNNNNRAGDISFVNRGAFLLVLSVR